MVSRSVGSHVVNTLPEVLMHLRRFARAAGFLGIPLGIAVLAAQQPQVLAPSGAEVQVQFADLLFADGRYREARDGL